MRFDISSQSWPIVFLNNQFLSFLDLEMACQGIVVVRTDYIGSDNLW